MKYLKIIINETGCSCPNQSHESNLFNQIVERKKSIEEVENYLAERYGKKISKSHRKNRPIFIDKKDGSTEQVGFLYSFWNKDWSHNSKNWFQTDWIEVREVEEKPVMI